MPEIGLVAFLLVLAVLGGWGLRRRQLGPAAIWLWGWVVLFSDSIVMNLQDRVSWAAPLCLVFESLFPLILLAGARAYADRRPLPWLIGAGLALGALRALLLVAGHGAVAHGLAGVLEPPIVLLAAHTVHRAPRVGAPSTPERVLPWTFVALAGLELGNALAFGLGQVLGLAVLGWLVLGPTAALTQMMAIADRAGARQVLRERERRRAESALRESEGRFRALTENIDDLVAELDSQGRVLYLSRSHVEKLGLPLDRFIGTSAFELVGPRFREAVERRFHHVLAKGGAPPTVWEWPGPGQTSQWFETRARAFEAPDGEQRVVVSTRDVTEHKRMEEELRRAQQDLKARIEDRTRALAATNVDLEAQIAEREQAERMLRESEERYRRISEISSDYSYAIRFRPDGNWGLEWLIGAFTRITGYTLEEAERLGWRSIVSPGDWPALRSRYKAVLAGFEEEIEFRLTTKAGEECWLAERCRVVRDESTGDTLLLGAAHDITKRKRAEEERRQIETQLRESQRLESMGLLASGVAHDFNNLLAPILGNSDLALEGLEAGSPVRLRLERIRRAARYAAGLVQQILTYSGKASVSLEPLDLSTLVRNLLGLLDAAVAKRGRIEAELPEGLPPMRGDPTQIRQVVMNLISNAADSLGDAGGKIRIRTGSRAVDRRVVSGAMFGSDLLEGEVLFLEVEDSGEGMEAEMRERIFDPFFTTKVSGRGLGLATVLGIVRGHEGAILLESEPGKGTRFEVMFPITGVAAAQTGAPAPRPARDARGGTILVVDDEEPVSEVAREMLERAGFSVCVATGGAEGIDVFAANSTEIDVVLLDLVMPDGGGERVFREIRDLAPATPIVLASGYSEDVAARRFHGSGLSGFVQKPYDPELLVECVSRVLSR